MSGIGPVEPGEGTLARDTPDPETPPLPKVPRGPLTRLYARHRRAALAAGMSAAVLVVGGYLYVTRPRQPPAPAPPYPSQVTEVAYAGKEDPSPNHPRGAFTFAVEFTVRSGPAVTVLRIDQPSAGFSLTSDPHPRSGQGPVLPTGSRSPCTSTIARKCPGTPDSLSWT